MDIGGFQGYGDLEIIFICNSGKLVITEKT